MKPQDPGATLPRWVVDAGKEASRRYLVGGVPGHQFMIVRTEGEADQVRPIARPAATSRLQSYHVVLQARVIYALRVMGLRESRAREVWSNELQHLSPPWGVDHVLWYLSQYLDNN